MAADSEPEGTPSARAEVDGEPQVFAPGGFPYVARLELDELLEQLIARARDVQATQGRLRGLLRANRAVAAGVDLDQVLQDILQAALNLVDARYAALEVIEQGRLVRFLHSGMDEQTVAAIGRLPEGKGLLGRLIDYPEPLRLPAIGTHMASVGFPEHHPPMRSLLGVPVWVGQQVYGNLYLTDKNGAAEFSRDDEELVIALAAAAGAAIAHAALFAESHRRQRWQAVMAAMSTSVLTTDPEQALAVIMRHAASTAECVGAAIAVPDDQPGHIRVATAEGPFNDRAGTVSPAEGTIYGQAMMERRIIAVADVSTDPRTADRAVPGVGPTVAVPMLTEVSANGVLFLCRGVGESQFDSVDLEMLSGYATHAALVLQLATSRHDNEQLRLADDRLQIAEELRTSVMQRISRLGLDLQALAARAADPAVRAGLQAKVTQADEIITALRAAVFALQDTRQIET
jgi:GAF domain-containing protein